MKKAQIIEYLRYVSTVSCCGSESSWPGKIEENVYYCRTCQRKMKLVVTEVRTKEEAELAFKGYKFVEACADCGAKHNHTLEAQDDGFFLRCGQCKEELREVEEKEIDL